MTENQGVEFPQQPVATRTRRFSNSSGIYSQPVHPGFLEDGNVDDVIVDEIISILKKDDTHLRTEQENKLLEDYSFLVPIAETRIKAQLAKNILKQRAVEREESLESIERKSELLAQLIEESNHIVIYTGAGISTAASIPDYRGPNGLWTQIRKTGAFSITKLHDLTAAEPTFTHMAIKELCRRRIVNHVVSQNCDGLHLRSGIAQSHLSEIHGNMYIEVCPTCEKQYFRQADVTERTSRFRHKTGRKCHSCAEPNNNLIDTIVLYGERSRTQWPMNWERASKAAKRADLIICMGSSLKTLRRYECLWPKSIHGSGNREPETKLVIVNLQYTPKDKNAVLKINGKCDLVMQLVLQKLNINVPAYDWSNDPLLRISTPFTSDERASLKRNLIFETKILQQHQQQEDEGGEALPQSSSPNSGSMKRSYELSKSPSLFVSELTDDPEKKRLRMRIRAVNANDSCITSSGNPNESSTSQEDIDTSAPATPIIKDEKQNELDKPSINQAVQKIDYALPGWLGKSLASSKSSSYRRKRHGNKGRSHLSVLKRQNESTAKVSTANDETATELQEGNHSIKIEQVDSLKQVSQLGVCGHLPSHSIPCEVIE